MSVLSVEDPLFETKKQNYLKLRRYAMSINNPELRGFVLEGVDKMFSIGDGNQLRHGLALHSYPVSPEEFMFGQNYLRRPKQEIYPEILSELLKINDGHGRVINRLTEMVATGGIGSGKTSTALYTNAYQLYLLSCYRSPHLLFGLDSTSEILIIFQSLNATAAKDVDYTRFRAICSQSYYFTTTFPFDKQYESALKFPNRIECKPIGSDGGSIGQNVIGGLIDEVNFMAVIGKSKKSTTGGSYNQAQAIYDSVSRRIKSRFVNNGGMPGILCLVSSKNYPGEFTDVKLEEAKTDPTIYIYDKRVWEVKPAGTFGEARFQVFTGDETRKPRLLKSASDVPSDDQHLVIDVPVEYRNVFESDIIGSLRDIAGVGTSARFPYMLNAERVSGAFGRRSGVLNVDIHDFNSEQKIKVFLERITDPKMPRWAHVDLSLSNDSTGIACGYVSGFVPTSSGSNELMPIIEFDFVLQIIPPKGDEIRIHKIRELFYKLRTLGLPIKWVTFDSFQSVDSLQLLRQQGFVTGQISTDTTIAPYELAKSAFYENRVRSPKHAIALKEFLALEKVTNKNKVDHPTTGSKDCSDAMASVIYGLSTRREIWGLFRIPLIQLPESIRTIQQAKGVGEV